MKVKVNKDRCIGCGACVATCPAVFEFGDDGLALVKAETVPQDKEEETKEAMDFCPGMAITEE